MLGINELTIRGRRASGDLTVERSWLDPMDAFETWLLHRVAEAVGAEEVSASPLTELQAEISEDHEKPLAELELARTRN